MFFWPLKGGLKVLDQSDPCTFSPGKFLGFIPCTFSPNEQLIRLPTQIYCRSTICYMYFKVYFIFYSNNLLACFTTMAKSIKI